MFLYFLLLDGVQTEVTAIANGWMCFHALPSKSFSSIQTEEKKKYFVDVIIAYIKRHKLLTEIDSGCKLSGYVFVRSYMEYKPISLLWKVMLTT